MFGIHFNSTKNSFDDEEMNVTSRYNKKARKGQEQQHPTQPKAGPFKSLYRGRNPPHIEEKKGEDIDHIAEFEKWVDNKTLYITGCDDDHFLKQRIKVENRQKKEVKKHNMLIEKEKRRQEMQAIRQQQQMEKEKQREAIWQQKQMEKERLREQRRVEKQNRAAAESEDPAPSSYQPFSIFHKGPSSDHATKICKEEPPSSSLLFSIFDMDVDEVPEPSKKTSHSKFQKRRASENATKQSQEEEAFFPISIFQDVSNESDSKVQERSKKSSSHSVFRKRRATDQAATKSSQHQQEESFLPISFFLDDTNVDDTAQERSKKTTVFQKSKTKKDTEPSNIDISFIPTSEEISSMLPSSEEISSMLPTGDEISSILPILALQESSDSDDATYKNKGSKCSASVDVAYKSKSAKKVPSSAPISIFHRSSGRNGIDNGDKYQKQRLEKELDQTKKLLHTERAEKRVLQERLDSIELKYKNHRAADVKYTERIQKLQHEIERCHKELIREKTKRSKMDEELQQARQETKNCQERMRRLMFQHIPSLSPKFKDIGPVDYNLKEEIVPDENDGGDKKGGRGPSTICRSVGDYQLGKVLGEGHYGKVQQATNELYGQSYAIKILSKDRVRGYKDFQQIATEIFVLKNCQHPNIIGLHDVVHSPTSIYLVMELCNMDIHKYHSEFGFNEQSAKNVFLGILRPLTFLHGKGICHLDLKPENLLLTRNCNIHNIHYNDVRICDFGLVHTSESETSLDVVRKGYACGTPGFYAPEMILQKQFEGRIADMWSAGCILLELTLGFTQEWLDSYEHVGKQQKRVTNSEDDKEDVEKFRKGLETCLAEIAREAYYPHHQQLLDLIHRCLTIDPSHRVRSHRAIRHPWLHSITMEEESNELSYNTAPPEKRQDMTMSPQYSHSGSSTTSNTSSTSSGDNTRADVLSAALDGAHLSDSLDEFNTNDKDEEMSVIC